LNNVTEIEALYEELFSFGVDDKTKASAIKTKKLQADKMIEQTT
jgi:hypothetical protein